MSVKLQLIVTALNQLIVRAKPSALACCPAGVLKGEDISSESIIAAPWGSGSVFAGGKAGEQQARAAESSTFGQ